MFRCLFLLFVNFELVGQESRIVGEKSGKKWRNIKEWWGGGNWKKENYKKRNERVKERVKKMEIKEVVCVWEREGRKEKDVGMMEELVLPIFVGFHVCLFSQMCACDPVYCHVRHVSLPTFSTRVSSDLGSPLPHQWPMLWEWRISKGVQWHLAGNYTT